MKTITPYNNVHVAKKAQVSNMFNGIARHYDFLNHFMSLGIDRGWRKKAAILLKHALEAQANSEALSDKKVLDLATGTGDLAIMIQRVTDAQIIGCDIAESMLDIGKDKINKLGLEDQIKLNWGDSEDLKFEDDSFDGVTCAFGVRNFEDVDQGLEEAYRVLKPGGALIILEFSKPKYFPMKQLFKLYFHGMMPRLGAWISKDKSAYSYLPKSIQAFPDGADFIHKLKKIGFINNSMHPLTFNICTVYQGMKAED